MEVNQMIFIKLLTIYICRSFKADIGTRYALPGGFYPIYRLPGAHALSRSEQVESAFVRRVFRRASVHAHDALIPAAVVRYLTDFGARQRLAGKET